MINEEREKKIILDLFCRKNSIALTHSSIFENNDFCILGVNLDFKHLINSNIDGDIDLLYIPLEYPKNYNECMVLNKNIEILPNFNRIIANEIKTQYINKEDKLKSLKYNTENKLISFLKQTDKLYHIGFLNSNLIFININEPKYEITGIETWMLESKRVQTILDDMINSKEVNKILESDHNFSISVFETALVKNRDVQISSSFSKREIYTIENDLNGNYINEQLKNILKEKINPLLPNEIYCWNLPLIIRMCKGKDKHLYLNSQGKNSNCPICNSIPS